MLHELWDGEGEDGPTFCTAGPGGDGARSMLGPTARIVWTVEAASYFEAMTLYYAHMGWGEYTTEHEWDRRSYAENGLE
ncbi:hypothetical protein ACSMXN_07300 [Jatrophihabitans sp. DSM 45814]